MGLSRKDFATLLGVSLNTVFLWENKTGALKIRAGKKAGILALRGVGKREVKRRLDDQD